MSLINEALKKAQRQRTLDHAPLAGAPTGVAAAAVTTHVRAASHRRSYAPVWFGLGLLVLGAVSTVLIMRYGFPADPAPVAATPAPVVAATPAPTPVAIATPAPQPIAPAPQSPVAVASEPAITFSLPPSAPTVATPPAPASAPAPIPASVTTPSSAPVAVATPAPTPAPAPVAVVPVARVAAAPTAAEREAKIYAFLSAIRLTGVRGVDREARVLMNEKVYRLNDTVDADLGLRLSGVRPGLLLFTDSTGRVYEKRL